MDARRESLHHARPLRGKEAALLVNLSSGLFTAFAGFFLARTIYAAAGWVAGALRPRRWQGLQRAVAAFSGALAFGWCDSTWYSAVEAEVYAMSIFADITVRMADGEMGVLPHAASCHTLSDTSRLYLRAFTRSSSAQPALHPRSRHNMGDKAGSSQMVESRLHVSSLSLLVVGCILTGIMPSTIALAAQTELICVNTLGLPFLSGVAIYVVLLGCSLLTALAVTSRSTNRGECSLRPYFPPFSSPESSSSPAI